MMEKRQIPLFTVWMPPTAKDGLLETMYSGFIGEGPKTAAFEASLQTFLDHPFAALVNSGTTSLKLALKLAGVEHGSKAEVLTTPLTCFAATSAIINAGGIPRWVDVDPITCNIDLDDLASKISSNTKAVQIVHWGGHPVDMIKLRQIVPRHIPIIQDCAHALGTVLKGKHMPFYGDFACFSFQAIKHINTGSDGGLLSVPNETLYKRAKLLRWFGIDRDDKTRLAMRCEADIAEVGDKYHLNDFCSSIGLDQMNYLEETLQITRSNAAYYDEALKGIPGILSLPPPATTETKSAYWLYTIRVERRGDFQKMMAARGIGANAVHIRNDLNSCVAEYKTNLPQLDQLQHEHISIPIHRKVSKEDREYIVEAIKGGW